MNIMLQEFTCYHLYNIQYHYFVFCSYSKIVFHCLSNCFFYSSFGRLKSSSSRRMLFSIFIRSWFFIFATIFVLIIADFVAKIVIIIIETFISCSCFFTSVFVILTICRIMASRNFCFCFLFSFFFNSLLLLLLMLLLVRLEFFFFRERERIFDVRVWSVLLLYHTCWIACFLLSSLCHLEKCFFQIFYNIFMLSIQILIVLFISHCPHHFKILNESLMVVIFFCIIKLYKVLFCLIMNI